MFVVVVLILVLHYYIYRCFSFLYDMNQMVDLRLIGETMEYLWDGSCVWSADFFFDLPTLFLFFLSNFTSLVIGYVISSMCGISILE